MAREPKPGRAALGFSVHTGWAAMVAVALGPGAAPMLLGRRRVVMIPGTDPDGPPFVYHALRDLGLELARRAIREWADEAVASARAAIGAAVEDWSREGCEAVASGLVGENRATPAALEAILKSHARIHAAEGEFYRAAIRQASEVLGLRVSAVPARDLHPRLAALLGIPLSSVSAHLRRTGRAAGSPFGKDQKEAFLAAWIALAG